MRVVLFILLAIAGVALFIGLITIPIWVPELQNKRVETIDVNDYHKYLQENSYPTHSESVNIKCRDKWLTYKDETPFFDYCIQNHYDYRGLIDKGLAIEATEENNPYKKD